jgi:hypothetical protein
MNLAEYKQSNTHKCILYGAPKSGKTAAVGLLAKHYNLLWFDGEKGVTTLLNPDLALTPEHLGKVELIQTLDTPSLPLYAELCAEVVKWKTFTACHEHGKLKCPMCTKDSKPVTTIDFSTLDDSWIVVFDSLTQLSQSVLNMVKIARVKVVAKLPETQSEWVDYGKQGAWLDNFLTSIQNAPFNVVVISHEQGIEQEDGREKLQPVGGTRNFSRNVPRYFDHVIRCEIKNKRHMGASSTIYSNNVMAGSRTGVVTEKHEDATESILRLIYNRYTNYKKVETK